MYICVLGIGMDRILSYHKFTIYLCSNDHITTLFSSSIAILLIYKIHMYIHTGFHTRGPWISHSQCKFSSLLPTEFSKFNTIRQLLSHYDEYLHLWNVSSAIGPRNHWNKPRFKTFRWVEYPHIYLCCYFHPRLNSYTHNYIS